nr:MAG TPA: hypothetical protein [Caudoviricetes sp.]
MFYNFLKFGVNKVVCLTTKTNLRNYELCGWSFF